MKLDINYPEIAKKLLTPPKTCESCRYIFPYNVRHNKWVCTLFESKMDLEDHCPSYRYDWEYYQRMLQYQYGDFLDA
jgi:hypothetical protein